MHQIGGRGRRRRGREDGDDEEEEGQTSFADWRDVEAEGRQFWFGSSDFIDPITKVTSKKLASPLQCLSLKKIEEPTDEIEQLQELPNIPLQDLKVAYVVYICFTWELLHCQYTNLSQKKNLMNLKILALMIIVLSDSISFRSCCRGLSKMKLFKKVSCQNWFEVQRTEEMAKVNGTQQAQKVEGGSELVVRQVKSEQQSMSGRVDGCLSNSSVVINLTSEVGSIVDRGPASRAGSSEGNPGSVVYNSSQYNKIEFCIQITKEAMMTFTEC
ncbi:hypothetical protein POM88_026048 [Heracleum sosnowskyi]|uniref:Uncharacterized protein n=1 Tax=Heracleum sosnowskyi TaxID=360622 RepID=A0AAD8I6D5_9APIA|nr:hypothetical protein POM88_026048 [Heracleum sosnowskyi]